MPISWVCEIVDATSTCTVTATSSAPLLSQDLGVIFGLGILIVLIFLMGIGFMFNHLNSKKPWL